MGELKAKLIQIGQEVHTPYTQKEQALQQISPEVYQSYLTLVHGGLSSEKAIQRLIEGMEPNRGKGEPMHKIYSLYNAKVPSFWKKLFKSEKLKIFSLFIIVIYFLAHK